MHRQSRGASTGILFIACVFVLVAAGCVASPVVNPPRELPTAVPTPMLTTLAPVTETRIAPVDNATLPLQLFLRLDLSRPRWDAWFSLAPDGKRLLLTNGRGGFWTSQVTYSNGEDV